MRRGMGIKRAGTNRIEITRQLGVGSGSGGQAFADFIFDSGNEFLTSTF